MRISNPIGEELNDPSLEAYACIQVEVFMSICILAFPVERQRCKEDNDANLKSKNCIQHVVHHLHHFADLSRCFLGILHYLGLNSYVQHYTIAVFSISQGTTSQYSVLDATISYL